jgi:hypothetical protein
MYLFNFSVCLGSYYLKAVYVFQQFSHALFHWFIDFSSANTD